MPFYMCAKLGMFKMLCTCLERDNLKSDNKIGIVCSCR